MNTKINLDILDDTQMYVEEQLAFVEFDPIELEEITKLRLPTKRLYVSAADRKRIAQAKALYAKSLKNAKAAGKLVEQAYRSMLQATDKMERQVVKEDRRDCSPSSR